MNDNAKKWVAALRSGEYKQGKNALTRTTKNGERHCCLGVACDLYLKEHPSRLAFKEVAGTGTTYREYRASDGTVTSANLPPVVVLWLGLNSRWGFHRLKSGKGTDLAALNDAGKRFKTIAKTIEAEPRGLFA